MNFGVSLALFLTLSILLMALFCFVTRYFHNKLKKARQEHNEVYSMIDQIQVVQQNQEEQAEYNEFLKQRNQKHLYDNKKKNQDDNMLVEMADMRRPLKGQNNLYGKSGLRRKLNEEAIPAKQESARSINTMKSFRPDKINSMTNRSDNSNKSQSKRNETTFHKFVNKIVCYDKKGLSIIDIFVSSICKLPQGEIHQNKIFKPTTIDSQHNSFEDQLDIIGFDKGDFGCYKYETTVEIINMKTGDDYTVRSLKTSESKEKIEFQQYKRLKAAAQETNKYVA